MIEQDLEHFLSLAEAGNFVPVYQEWVADLETPVSAWYKVCAGQPYSFLLESVEGGEKLGRYSFLGCDPVWILEIKREQTTQTYRDGTLLEFTGNPFDILPQCIAQIQPVQLAELPPGIGGLFGFWGYEAIRWLEPKVPTYPTTEGDLPDGIWMQVDNLVVFDQVKRKIWAIATVCSTKILWNRGASLWVSHTNYNHSLIGTRYHLKSAFYSILVVLSVSFWATEVLLFSTPRLSNYLSTAFFPYFTPQQRSQMGSTWHTIILMIGKLSALLQR